MRRLQEGLYLLESGGSVNAYLIETPLGLTLVDAGPPGAGAALVQELSEAGFLLDDLRHILLTHAHADHFGGVAEILRRRRVKVFAHPDDIPALLGKAPLPPAAEGFLGRLRRRLAGLPAPEPLDVVVPVRGGDPLRALARWQILHTPGHTPGSLSLYDPARGIVVCGDAVTARGKTLKSGAFEDSAAGASHALRALAALKCEVLCCGHGVVVRSGAGRKLRELADGRCAPL